MTVTEQERDALTYAADGLYVDRPRTFRQWLFRKPADRWRPTQDERDEALEWITETANLYRFAKDENKLLLRLMEEAGQRYDRVGNPLTFLWIASLIVEFIKLWRERRAEVESTKP